MHVQYILVTWEKLISRKGHETKVWIVVELFAQLLSQVDILIVQPCVLCFFFGWQVLHYCRRKHKESLQTKLYRLEAGIRSKFLIAVIIQSKYIRIRVLFTPGGEQ